jgi:hypothetical protein
MANEECSVVLCVLTYYCVLIYALWITNVTEFHNGCGHVLWPFMLAHTLIPWLIALGIGVAIWSNLTCCVGLSTTFAIQAITTATALFCATSLAVGTPILRDAIASSSCYEAMGHSPGSNSGWLLYSGLISLVFDAIALLICIIILILGCMGCFAVQTNSTPRHLQYHRHETPFPSVANSVYTPPPTSYHVLQHAPSSHTGHISS